ncbi:beta-ketoacyl-ACP synthase [Bermanella marisrubri]|uniref:Putative 3-oxoacyl-[acyl-carrier-protein] synthase synthase n=1 Tax=Bermanella marisrubri TaxID=207949 RepID=Q1N365_9GAMM|nr:beta-ketoacyl-[acyl-carrier-protein] synthase family protein [Bermanella marisrubri]EAT12726.1 putative 3-oxoacyl-[acyl-carrier-protein] synthase synthase [Oceanobacter sp. RED65] [Bermanella marisrubri]QIZ85155.1 beta-ketoacyl-ACP synthase [Bermanella marisrubri]
MDIERKRVVITGVGICSAIGQDKESFTDGLFACRSAIASSEEFNQFFEDCYAAQIHDEIQYSNLSQSQIDELDKVSLWAYKVAEEAMQDSNILDTQSRYDMYSLFAISGAATEPFMPVIKDDPVPTKMLAKVGNYGACASIVTELLGLKGGYDVVATACTASTNALGLGFDAIQNNKTQQALIVGSEPLYLPTFSGFKILDAMAQGPCSPFSGEPGMSVGEGAGALILEEYEHAKARGARIYAEVLGYATSCDAYHETSPEPKGEGASMVMNLALRNANVSADEIDYINVHGTGTAANDRAESAAVNRVFESNPDVPVSSTKSYFGHNISAAGIMEMVACLVTLPEKQLLPTLNFKQPREYVDLNVVANDFQHKDVNLFMKNNYAFGGNNCSLVASVHAGRHAVSRYQQQEVAITGIGNISSLGIGHEAFMEAIQHGQSQSELVNKKVLNNDDVSDLHWLTASSEVRGLLKRLPLTENGDLPLRLHQVAEFNPRKYLRSVDIRKLQPATIFAMVAMEKAISDAGLKVNKRNRDDIGMILGLSRGPQTALDNFFSSMKPEPSNVRTSEFPKALYNSISSSCATMKGIRGYNTTIATGYNAGLGAVIQGYEVIRQSMQELMIVGACDEQALGFSLVMHAAHQDESLNYQEDAESFRVYDENAQGYQMGEGAALMVLEPMQKARERSAKVYAQISGYGRANGTAADYAGALEKAMLIALDEGQISADQVDLICGSSCGHVTQDTQELDAIARIQAKNALVTNMNGYVGLLEATSGTLNLQAALCMIDNKLVYPILNTDRPIRDDVNLVLGNPTEKDIRYAMVIGASESGNCYALLVKRAN